MKWLPDIVWGFLCLAAMFVVLVYSCCMFYALLATPEPGWEWALAWQYMVNTFTN